MTGDRHNSNAELMAQGVANIVSTVLFVMAYSMGEWRETGSIWRLDWADSQSG